MNKGKSSISKASSYQMIGEYWDNHDLADIWEQTEPLELDVNIQSERKYYPIDSYISERLIEIAIKRGISPETLVNLWLQEKISQ
ncbi:MAG: hypothetical protein FVQ80_17545 [Planctomycetes bacterium]|nr:hypothetical protein [Planctomycetota bacterium]